ncbi:MAG: N-acyl-D-amino acid deacylase [Gemmatimonadales bacterium]|nr:MAG: N-acyl-D-amino acid deacylase [Gemmatimonadales bacterium]
MPSSSLRILPAVLVFLLAAACAPDRPDPEPGDDQARPDVLPVESTVPFDLLIRGGTLIDGSGAPPRAGDLLIRDGLIVHVGTVDADTVTVLDSFDARGLTVTPGFIDAHAHGDPTETPGFPNFLAQGVTTIVLGQDGSSPRPADMPALIRELELTPPAVNVAWLTGHNTIRMAAGVEFGEPDAAGLQRMAELAEVALDEGAFGLSLGLEYDPGVRAGMDELVAIARPVADRDGVVMSHMRNEDVDQVEDSLDELLEQGRLSGARVHVSHMKSVLGNDPDQARRMLDALAAARESGVEATGDVYPYTASFTGLSILFPEWARPPHDYDRVVANRRDELATHLRERVEGRNGPEATLFGSGPWAGMTLAQAAAVEDRLFEDLLVELGPGGATAAYFVMNEEVMTTFLADPFVVVGSDGSPTMRHPRGYGSFPLVIRRYVVDEELLPLEEAVRKMTGLTARILRLDDPERVEVPRGRLEEGWAADIAAFDPGEVRDRADFQNPHRLAEGMRRVWVNGVPAWTDGAPSEAGHAGLPLRQRPPGSGEH